jgi:ABC-type transporter Mla subunit MlaD
MTVVVFFVIGFITTKRLLKEEDIYYVAYSGTSVSGLEVGSPVKYLGIKVGDIRDIIIDPNDVTRIIVKLALKPETPIKQDAVADIATVGITGLKTIEIRGGSNNAPFLDQESFIQPGSSLTQDITGKAEVIAEKIEVILNNLQSFTRPENLEKITNMIEQISALAEQTQSTVTRLDSALQGNMGDIRATVQNARMISSRLDSSTQLVAESVSRVNQLIKSDTIDQILGGARDVAIKLKQSNLEGLIEDMGRAVRQTNLLLVKLNRDIDLGSDDFIVSLELLRTTLRNLEEASRKINRDPSLLLRGSETKGLPDQDLNR